MVWLPDGEKNFDAMCQGSRDRYIQCKNELD